MARIFIGAIIILLGISALLGISLFKFVFALLLVALGVRIITGKKDHWSEVSESISHADMVHEVAVFSSFNKTVKSENFKGGKAVLVFAGGQIDLSHAHTTEKEIELEFVTVFGGGKLIVPKEWNVESEGTAIVGGFQNKTERKGEVTLRVKGAAVFGGVEITN